MITSKPANGEWPGLVFFTLSPGSCLLDSDWTVRAIVFHFSSSLCPAVEAVETVGNSADFCRVFQAQWERWKTCSSFSTVSSCAAVSIAYGREKHFLQGSVKKLGPHSSSNEFFTAAEWYGLRGGGELSAQPAWAVNSVLVRQLRGPNFSTCP